MQPPPAPGPPRPPGGTQPPPPGGKASGAAAGAHMPGKQRLVFRLVQSDDAPVTSAHLELRRQPSEVLTVPLRDDGLSQLDQPSDGVRVGVDVGAYARLVQARLWVDHPGGKTLAWEGVLSVPDPASDGATWTLSADGGAYVAQPIAALPPGDSVAGLTGGHPMAATAVWGALIVALVVGLALLGRRGPGA